LSSERRGVALAPLATEYATDFRAGAPAGARYGAHMRTPSPADAPQNRQEAAAQLVALVRELVGGSLRWLATVLTIAGVLMLIGMYAEILPDEAYWPVQPHGTTSWVIAVFAVAFWMVIAVLNWRSHAKRPRRT
jgi:hypothetical protein